MMKHKILLMIGFFNVVFLSAHNPLQDDSVMIYDAEMDVLMDIDEFGHLDFQEIGEAVDEANAHMHALQEFQAHYQEQGNCDVHRIATLHTCKDPFNKEIIEARRESLYVSPLNRARSSTRNN
jgi:hypothetical protein